jgi:predicted DNA-binding transcriptional regulator AlpA
MAPLSTGLAAYEKRTAASKIDKEYLRRSEVCTLLGVSIYTLARWIKRGLFPSPTFHTPTSNVGVWRRTVVEAHLEKRRRARRVKPTPRGMLRNRKPKP